MCLHQNLGRRMWELEAPKIVSSRNRLHEGRYQLIEMQHWNQLSSDDSSRYVWRREKHVGLYKKGKIRVQVILNYEWFSLMPKIIMSRT